MFRRDLNFSVRGYVEYYTLKVIFIQRAWRRHNISLKQRMETLKETIWPSEMSQLTTHFIKRKGAQ